MAVGADLADLAVYEALLAHKGLVDLCACDAPAKDHYHDWGHAAFHLLQLLIDGSHRPHEPPTIPNRTPVT